MANILSQNAARTDGRVAICVPTSGYRAIAPLIRTLSDRLLTGKISSEFFVATANTKDSRGHLSDAAGISNVRIIVGPTSIASREMVALNLASFNRPDCVILTCDDRWDMVESIAAFSSAAANSDRLFFGSMDSLASKYVPYPYALACNFLSCAVSYATSSHPAHLIPRPAKFEAFLSSSDFSHSLKNTFLGFFGMRPEVWQGIMDGVRQKFFTSECKDGVAIEPVLQLSANYYGLSVSSVEVPRRYEHRIITGNGESADHLVKKYAIMQSHRFEIASRSILSIVVKTEPSKAAELERFISSAILKIRSAPLSWPGNDELKKSDCTLPLEFDLAYYVGKSRKQLSFVD